MARFIPPHPKKGSVEAQEWAARMAAARAKKKRLRHAIRSAGRKTEQAFFGKGGPLEVKTRRNPAAFYFVKIVNSKNETVQMLGPFPTKEYADKIALRERADGFFTYAMKSNPGERWHDGMAQVAGRRSRQAKTETEKLIYKGMEVAHQDSASAARKLGLNPKRARKPRKNPIAVYNPASPGCSPVRGVIYKHAIEIKAEKSENKRLAGFYKHAFGKNVRILGLDNGSVLLQHAGGKPLWIPKNEYERSRRRH